MTKKGSSQNKASDYIQTINVGGYLNNREITNLPGLFLVKGSQNVLIKNKEKVMTRMGYVLKGAAKTLNKGIKSNCDWPTSSNLTRSIRTYGTVAEVWYNNAWQTLMTGLTDSIRLRYQPVWKPTELIDVLLMVDGSNTFKEWSGAIAKVGSVTPATITINGYVAATTISFNDNGPGVADTISKSDGGFIAAGYVAGDTIVVSGSASNNGTFIVTNVSDFALTLDASNTLTNEVAGASVVIKEYLGTWGEQRFFSNTGGLSSDMAVTINNQKYTYTALANGVLTGVAPSPVGSVNQGDIAIQTPRSYSPSAITNLKCDLVSVLNNNVFFGSTTSRYVYITKNTDFTDFTQSTPRLSGEGATLTLDSCPTGFAPGEKDMYISAGRDDWYHIQFQKQAVSQYNASPIICETIDINKEKTSSGEAAISQEAIFYIKNAVAYLSFEKTIESLGTVAKNLSGPHALPISDPIRDDMDAYDTTNADGLYFERNLYIALPAEAKLLIYDMQNGYWQPPQLIPVGRLAIIDNKLCGHAIGSNETYQLNVKYNDNGSKFKAVAAFGYDNYGARFNTKSFDELALELYISLSTVVTDQINYDYQGATDVRTFTVNPSDPQNVNMLFIPREEASLGSNPLGSQPLGSSLFDMSNDLPKMRIVNSTSSLDFFERQRVVYTDSIDARFQIIALGENVEMSENQPTYIKR